MCKGSAVSQTRTDPCPGDAGSWVGEGVLQEREGMWKPLEGRDLYLNLPCSPDDLSSHAAEGVTALEPWGLWLGGQGCANTSDWNKQERGWGGVGGECTCRLW